jgi:cytoskeleton protein RodZ
MTPGEAALAETEQRMRAAGRPALRVVQEEPPAGEGPGARLAQLRIAQGRTIHDAANALRLKPRHLIALEAEDFSRLPSLGYALGFLRTYAAFLDAPDTESIANRFRQRWEDTLGDAPKSRPEPIANRRKPLPRSVWIAALFVGWLIVWAIGHAVFDARQSTDESALDAQVRQWMRAEGAPAPAPPVEAVAAQTIIRVVRPAWFEVRATDGSVIVSRVFGPEERFSPDGYGTWTLYATDASAVRVSVAGVEIPLPGGPGEALQAWRPPAPAPAAEAPAPTAAQSAAPAAPIRPAGVAPAPAPVPAPAAPAPAAPR